jgi:SnoaL-like protein
MTNAERWAEAWFRAWSGHDPDALAAVYPPGPVQRSEPFRERIAPHDYATWAFAEEESVEVWFAAPASETPDGAACEWWAVSTDTSGQTVTLAGVSVLRFDESGLVVDQRDYWSQREGRHEPPKGWGPVAHRRRGGVV